MNNDFDATRLTLLLSDLRLPATKQIWPTFAERSDKEIWPAARLLMTLAEHEIAERDRRSIERHLGEAKLLPGKTLDNFDFDAVPMVSKAQVSALCAGDNGANLILMGPPGGGKSHLSSAIGLSLLEKGWKVRGRVLGERAAVAARGRRYVRRGCCWWAISTRGLGRCAARAQRLGVITGIRALRPPCWGDAAANTPGVGLEESAARETRPRKTGGPAWPLQGVTQASLTYVSSIA